MITINSYIIFAPSVIQKARDSMSLQKQFKRKDLKKPDLLHIVTVRFYHYYEKHRLAMISAVCGLLILGVGAGGFIYNRQLNEMKMESLYYKMVKVWIERKDKSLGSAIKQLQDIITKIDEGKVKQRAKLLLADALFESKNFEQAIPLYTEVQEKSEAGQLDYDLARVGLGYSLEAKKDYNKAIEVYKSVISGNSNYPLFYIYFGLARCQSESGDKASAQLALREILNKFPEHGDIEKAQTMLKKLDDTA